MQHLIKEGQSLQDNNWTLIDNDTEVNSYTGYLAPVDALLSNPTDESITAIIVKDADDFNQWSQHIQKLSLIAFDFNAFANGRAFTFARTLREDAGFKGDIRALGNFIPDQVNYLIRSGFTSFACRNENEAQTALALLNTFSVSYQADAVESRPLFRRR